MEEGRAMLAVRFLGGAGFPPEKIAITADGLLHRDHQDRDDHEASTLVIRSSS
jgi:hypothetical protein